MKNFLEELKEVKVLFHAYIVSGFPMLWNQNSDFDQILYWIDTSRQSHNHIKSIKIYNFWRDEMRKDTDRKWTEVYRKCNIRIEV